MPRGQRDSLCHCGGRVPRFFFSLQRRCSALLRGPWSRCRERTKRARDGGKPQGMWVDTSVTCRMCGKSTNQQGGSSEHRSGETKKLRSSHGRHNPNLQKVLADQAETLAVAESHLQRATNRTEKKRCTIQKLQQEPFAQKSSTPSRAKSTRPEPVLAMLRSQREPSSRSCGRTCAVSLRNPVRGKSREARYARNRCCMNARHAERERQAVLHQRRVRIVGVIHELFALSTTPAFLGTVAFLRRHVLRTPKGLSGHNALTTTRMKRMSMRADMLSFSASRSARAAAAATLSNLQTQTRAEVADASRAMPCQQVHNLAESKLKISSVADVVPLTTESAVSDGRRSDVLLGVMLLQLTTTSLHTWAPSVLFIFACYLGILPDLKTSHQKWA